MIPLASRTAATAVRSAARNSKPVNGQQKRGIVDWMTNYPDKVCVDDNQLMCVPMDFLHWRIFNHSASHGAKTGILGFHLPVPCRFPT
mmetsp:Transcript_24660/g.32854  ORF Transcript_24660/g.32854 Transcript_24660/m.32854 type:complete len:88 (-) Transcript_24660:809-1072(-)